VPRIAIVTDSTADLPPALSEPLGIRIVPLNVHFGEQVFRDQVDLSTAAFMERLTSSAVLPKTSQPSPGAFAAVFEALAKDHDGIISIHISGKLSGTVQSAQLAKTQIATHIPIEVIDSCNVSLGLGLQVLRAAELASSGLDVEHVARQLRNEINRYHLVFFVDTLEYLQRGGRIGRAAALAGSVLRLKPVLCIEDGQVVPHERTRTRARAIATLEQFVRSLPRVKRLAVVHSTSPDDAERLAASLGPLTPNDPPIVATFGPVVATHAGPGAVGVIAYEGE
jgi:DegV family protein with EDD domain